MALGRTNAIAGNPLNFKVVVSADYPESISRNMIPDAYAKSTTYNGITYTVNGDGSITANGTATGTSVCNVWGSNNSQTLPAGTYALSGCPTGGGSSTYMLCSNDTTHKDTGSGVTFTLAGDTAISFKIRINSGVTVSNLKFWPQLERGSSKTAFIKYAQKENTIWIKSSIPAYGFEFRVTDAPNWSKDKGAITIGYSASYTGQVSNDSVAAFDIYEKANPVRKIHMKLENCFQNQDGTASGWKSMNAYLYKSGKWVQFSGETIYLYNAGDTCESVTGGWKGNGTNTTSALVVEVEHASYEGSYSDFGEKTTIDKVTIPSSAKTLSITYTTSGDWDSLTNRPFGLKSSGYANGEKGTEKFVAYTTLAAGTNVTATLDISSFAGGSYCVAVKGDSGTSNITSNAVVTISKIWID